LVEVKIVLDQNFQGSAALLRKNSFQRKCF